MKMRLFALLFLTGVFATSVITFANQSATTEVNISAEAGGVADVGESTGTIDAGATFATSNESPSWDAIEGSASSITKGDLFYINPNIEGEILVSVYLTNTAELAQAYSYLNQNIRVFYTTNGGNSWGTVLPSPDIYLTLTNGFVGFALETNGHSDNDKGYAVVVNGGSLYTHTASGGNLNPEYFIQVR